jgi:hypothetical protein
MICSLSFFVQVQTSSKKQPIMDPSPRNLSAVVFLLLVIGTAGMLTYTHINKLYAYAFLDLIVL